MLDLTTHQARVTGSKVRAGDSMRGVERIVTPDDFTANVFSRMQAIAGGDALPPSKSSGVTHITPEEAIRELLEIHRASVVHPLTSLQ